MKAPILIGIPTYDKKEYAWKDLAKAIKKIKSPLQDCKVHVYLVDTSEEIDFFRYDAEDEGFFYKHIQEEKRMDRVVKARNEIIGFALENNYSYILFLDSDVIVPKETLINLFWVETDYAASKKGKPVPTMISGTYIVTDEFGFPTPAAKIYVGKTLAHFPNELLDGRYHEVDLVGMGCCLIPREIFKDIKFRCERGKYGDVRKAEDVCYCEDALKKGYKILLDTSTVCTHKISNDSNWDDGGV